MKHLVLLSCLALAVAGCDNDGSFYRPRRQLNRIEAKIDSIRPCCTVYVERVDTVWAWELWGEGGQTMSKEQFDSTAKAVKR